ncbi:MAG: response regulator transcription factor [Armatimonadetes bacterium]|nr:response regulator transcription factor [Armatimonadota bacterium]
MTKLNAVILDDERLARENLKRMLAAYPQVEVVGMARNASEARKRLQAKKPDVVFLDVHMPGESGFDFLESLENPPHIVFVTAYDEYAIRAFEVNAVDYLLKPVEAARLDVTIQRVLGRVTREQPAELKYSDLILLDTNGRSMFVPLKSITVIMSDGNYTDVMDVAGNCQTVRRSLAEWRALLPEGDFVDLDRRTIINRHHVRQWQAQQRETDLFLGENSHPLRLGRTASERFKKMVEGENG